MDEIRELIADIFPCFRDKFGMMPCPYDGECGECPDFIETVDQILALLPKPLDLSRLKVIEGEEVNTWCKSHAERDQFGVCRRTVSCLFCYREAQYDSMVSEIKKQLGEK